MPLLHVATCLPPARKLLQNLLDQGDVITMSFWFADIQAAIVYCHQHTKQQTASVWIISSFSLKRVRFVFQSITLIVIVLFRDHSGVPLTLQFDLSSIWFYLSVSLLNLPQISLIRGVTWERWISRPAALSKPARMMFQPGTCLTSARVHKGDYGCWGSLSPSSPLILCPLMWRSVKCPHLSKLPTEISFWTFLALVFKTM